LITEKLEQRKFYNIRYSIVQRASHKLFSLPLLFYDKRLIKMILENSVNRESKIVLDVGTGQGTDAILIAQNVHHVVCIDISSSAIKTAKFLAKGTAHCKNLSFIVADAEHLPFREGVFDIVYCKDLLHHVSNPLKTMLEMKYVTKEKGIVTAVEANAFNAQMIAIGLLYFSIDKGVFKNTKKRLIALFSRVGLSNVNVVETEFFPRHVFFEFRSPVNKFIKTEGSIILKILENLESNLQKSAILRTFANYLVICGYKEYN